MSARRTAPTPLACQREPDRWFDRAHRRYALQRCLACPARRRCAAEALRHKPIAGMWAGIWIDGQFERAAEYLRAIAADAPRPYATAAAGDKAAAPLLPAAGHGQPVPKHGWRTPRSVRAAVAARSSGHCELMAPECRYSATTILSRLPGLRAEVADCPSLVFEACGPCAITLSRCDPVIARRRGYVIGAAHDGLVIPFYWRQARWVLLTGSGHLGDAGDAGETACTA